MVRHHVKKKKNDKKSNASKKDQEQKKRLEEELENLDRFAGSSDEEEEGDRDENEDRDDTHHMRHNNGDASDGESSDDDDSEDDYDDVYQEDMKEVDTAMQSQKKPIKPKYNEDVDGSSGEENDDNDSENDYNDAEQSDDDDDEMMPGGPRDAKSLGMANAMSRILGGQSAMMFPPTSEDDNKDATKSSAKGPKPVILSKTTTPLQRLQQKIKTEERALRQKRHNRRAENLSAMRLPLAPTAGMSAEKLWKQKAKKKKKGKRKRDDDGEDIEEEEEIGINRDAKAVAAEIEAERTHRRIATRGAVALFNAISKHRAAVAAEAAAKEEEKRRIREEGRLAAKKRGGDDEDAVSSKTKHGFLDMIKKSAAATSAGVSSGANEAKKANDKENESLAKRGKAESKGWSALKDDFMMNSKLKDWDKEISDDDDSELGKNYDDESLSGGEGAKASEVKETFGKRKGGRKRQKA